VSRTQYQYTLEDPDQATEFWTAKLMATASHSGAFAIWPRTSRLPAWPPPSPWGRRVNRFPAWASRRKRSPDALRCLLDSASFDALYPSVNQYQIVLETHPSFRRTLEITGHLRAFCSGSTASHTGSSVATSRTTSSGNSASSAAQPFRFPIRLSAPVLPILAP